MVSELGKMAKVYPCVNFKYLYRRKYFDAIILFWRTLNPVNHVILKHLRNFSFGKYMILQRLGD